MELATIVLDCSALTITTRHFARLRRAPLARETQPNNERAQGHKGATITNFELLLHMFNVSLQHICSIYMPLYRRSLEPQLLHSCSL
jgi:hypothetical protein